MIEAGNLEKTSVSVGGDGSRRRNRARRLSRLPPITAPGSGKNAMPMATLGSANAPSSLARRLAAGHADKDAHDADE